MGAFEAEIQVKKECIGSRVDAAYRIYKARRGREGMIQSSLIMGGEGPIVEVGTGDQVKGSMDILPLQLQHRQRC
jgi:hypothetical protein